MSFTSEVERMKKIIETLTKETDAILAITYTEEEIINIIEEYFPEGSIALSQCVDLYTILKDFKRIYTFLSFSVDNDKFDKICRAIIDYESDGVFNFR